MPANAKILHVDVQNEVPCIWAEIDTIETQKVERRFHIFGTGHKMPAKVALDHLGTFLIDHGRFVFHVYEELA